MFSDCAKPLSKEEIKEVEQLLQINLPEEFKNHYLQYNGGIPENEHFYMEEYDTFLWLNNFLSLKHENENVKDWTVEKCYLNYVNKKIIPREYVPFATDLGGNLICVNIKDKAIYIIYMDSGNPKEDADSFRKLAESFDCFINNLEEEEEEDI